MTHEEAIRWISSFTQREVEAREKYYRTHSETQTVPPLPEGAAIIPPEKWPDTLYKQNCPIVPYWHERYLDYDFHDHEYIELMYQVSGCCSNTIEASSSILNRGDMCLLPPGVFHLPEINDDDGVMVNLLIKTEALAEIFQNFLPDHNHPLTVFFQNVLYGRSHQKFYYIRGFHEKIHYLICEILVEYIEDRPFRDLVIKNHTTNLLCELYRMEPSRIEISQEFTASSKSIMPILQYIYRNYRTVTLRELSECFAYSPQYICRMFKIHTGKSFTDFLTELKITRVQNLLINTDFRIAHIAELCGFDCIPYFHRKFKSIVGCTPAQFRQRGMRLKQSGNVAAAAPEAAGLR